MNRWAPTLFLSLNETAKRYHPPYEIGETQAQQMKRNQNKNDVGWTAPSFEAEVLRRHAFASSRTC